MRLVQRGLLALPVALLAGCFTNDGGDCFRPIQEFIPPEAPADDAEGGVGAGGQCAAWVEIGDDGNWYLDTRSEGWRFDIDDAALKQNGEAAEATHLVHSVAEATVWSLNGLDPGDFVVMRAGDDREFFILVQQGAHLRVEVDEILCRYATGPEHMLRERCGGGIPASGQAP